MRSMKNVVEKAQDMIGKINPYYDMSFGNIMEIYEKSDNPINMISTSFSFGYMQGMKAAKAEMKKGGAVNG